MVFSADVGNTEYALQRTERTTWSEWKLVEDGFEYVCQKDEVMLFRKRK